MLLSPTGAQAREVLVSGVLSLPTADTITAGGSSLLHSEREMWLRPNY
ncbi:MAG: hypothetical protein ABSH48_20990 [Verrucomicrobiota bacterium]|jgi:hypothetical protein